MNKKQQIFLLLFINVISSIFIAIISSTVYAFLNCLIINSFIIIILLIEFRCKFTYLYELNHQNNNTQYKQLEAYQNLINTLKPIAPLPPLRGWAASPDFLNHLYRIIIQSEPKVIVEASSGASTLVCGYALKKLNYKGKVISLDHDDRYANQTIENCKNSSIK